MVGEDTNHGDQEHQPWHSCCQQALRPEILTMSSNDGWWRHQACRPGIPTMATRDTNHGFRGHQFCKTSAILLSLSFLPSSTLLRLLFGLCSDLVRSCFGKYPNKVRTRSERKKTESGTRLEQEWNKII